MPSRVYVGVVVFGLMASTALLAYTILALTGYTPPGDAPHEFLFPAESPFETGDKVALVMASLFALAFTVIGWRALVAGARRDAKVRRGEGAGAAADATVAQPFKPERRADEEQPPGYQ